MRRVGLDWKVHCFTCKKNLAPGQPKYKLKNIAVHVSGQTKDGKLSEHVVAFGKAKERAIAEAVEAKQQAEDVSEKRRTLLRKYRADG